jgi:putative transposase
VLGHDDLSGWFRRLDISEPARSLINDIRSSGPSRRVGGGHSNVSGRYPSRKMGVTIQFESHRVELAGIHEMEHDATVLEYFDQPPSIKLDYESAAGKRMSVLHTPDFFVIRQGEAGWEEWKTEEDLRRLNTHNPNRYSARQDGQWHCPPGTAYAERLGLYYRVRSSAEIDWVFQRNIEFLDDYLRCERPSSGSPIQKTIRDYIVADPGTSLSELFARTKDAASRDVVYSMIARGELHVDLRAALMVEPDRVLLFTDSAEAIESRQTFPRQLPNASLIDFRPGTPVSWDGRIWEIANIGEKTIGLLGEDKAFVEIPLPAIEKLLKDGRIVGTCATLNSGMHSEVARRFAAAAKQDLDIANQRASAVRKYLRDGRIPPDIPARTLLRWVSRFRNAQDVYGNGYCGLLPDSQRRGNRSNRLPAETRSLMLSAIEEGFETLKQKGMLQCWAALKNKCDDQGVACPSYVTFCCEVRKRPAFDRTLKRQGPRSAYNCKPFYWNLDLAVPRHGDRPFEIVHIDHTEADIELVSSEVGRSLGRPWLTLMIDAFSRRVLAIYLAFDPPSYRSCMMVLRECVRRHMRLPQTIVVDNGAEFRSTYFESLLARYECTKKQRPPAQSRFGSICERLFGSANTQFFHNLRGNTKIVRNVRQVTKGNSPKGLATWTLPELHDRLCQYLFDIYDTTEHPALSQTPREAFCRGLESTGSRGHRLVRYTHDFLMATLPTTSKGTAKVLPGRGVKINHFWYWTEAFREPGVENHDVAIRYDPFDAGTAYAYLRGQWAECHSEQHSILKGRSEKELKFVTEELRRRQQAHSQDRFTVSAPKLAEFMSCSEAQESFLLQRMRDQESKIARLGLTEQPSVPTDSVDAAEDYGGTQPAINELEIYGEF